MSNTPIFCAVDKPDLESAISLCQKLPEGVGIKLGLEFFNALGIHGVKNIQNAHPDIPIFLDLKYHDIPNTVANACKAAAELGVWMLNVHASGGQAMLQAAREAIDSVNGVKPLLIAVTVLTSLTEQDLQLMGLNVSVDQQVMRLAQLCQQVGIDGVVCSAHEVSDLKAQLGEAFLTVTPGIRLASHDKGDQKRITTPEQAINMGADYLVIGRPITQSAQPQQTLQSIVNSIKE